MVSLPGSPSIREQLEPPFRGPPVRRQLEWVRIEGDCRKSKGDESRCTGPSPDSVRQSGTSEIRSGMASVHGAASAGRRSVRSWAGICCGWCLMHGAASDGGRPGPRLA